MLKMSTVFVSVRDKRNKLTEKVVEARKALIEAIHENEDQLSVRPDGVKVYRYGDTLVELKPRSETVAVKPVKLDEGEEDDDDY